MFKRSYVLCWYAALAGIIVSKEKYCQFVPALFSSAGLLLLNVVRKICDWWKNSIWWIRTGVGFLWKGCLFHPSVSTFPHCPHLSYKCWWFYLFFLSPSVHCLLDGFRHLWLCYVYCCPSSIIYYIGGIHSPTILNVSSSSFVPKPCLETLISEASCYLQNVQLSGLLVGWDIHCMVASRASE